MPSGSADAALIVKDLIKNNYPAGSSLKGHVSFRVSPPNDEKITTPTIVVKKINSNEDIKNVHATRYRETVSLWIYCLAPAKDTLATLCDDLITVHRAIWTNPGSGLKFILHKGWSVEDQLDWNPQMFQQIAKWETVIDT